MISSEFDIQTIKDNDTSPKFYQYYPRLFESYFTNVDKKTIEKLCDAGYLYYHSILCLDSIVDDKQFSNLPSFIQLQEESIKILTGVYGKDSEFWNYWNKRKKEYFEAIAIEKQLSEKRYISFKEYKSLADKKAAFGKVAIDCLYLLSNKKDKKVYNILLKSHTLFSIGFQLYDDIQDFKEDFESKQLNWTVYQLQKNTSLKTKNSSFLNKHLFLKGVAQKELKKAINYFQKAIETLKPLNIESNWQNTILESKQIVRDFVEITNGYIKCLSKKIDLKKELPKKDYFFDFSDIKNHTIKRGLEFVKKDFTNNYAELKHIMYLGKIEGFDNSEEIHVSDTFQRALINECLITASQKNNLDLNSFIEKECTYLLGLQNKDKIGVWSYFPTVKEIAPDIDDLGQMIQLFCSINKQNLVGTHCDKAINIVLSDRFRKDGGIETWIIPRNGQTKIQQKQELFNKTKWGEGPDLEVVANFIYALQVYQPHRYKKQIKKSIDYILKHQNKEGFWVSRWYYGNYYGIYVCLRLLKCFDIQFQKNVKKALNYIKNNQSFDGGFSLNNREPSDPLSTSLALLSLSFFEKKDSLSVKRAKKYLISSQNDGGFWSEVDFIMPKVHEPYKSKTLTTAFVLKALT